MSFEGKNSNKIKSKHYGLLFELLLISILIGSVAPSYYNKFIIIFSFVLLFILSINAVSKISQLSIFNILFFLPGIIVVAFNHPFELIRFFPVLYIIIFSPFCFIKINGRVLRYTCVGILIYLIFSQILIASNSVFWVEIRDNFYPVDKNVFEYGELPNEGFQFRTFRAGGIFYNPNVLGLVILLIYLIFLKFNSKSSLILNIILSVFCFFSLILTGSRTAIAGLILYFLLNTIVPYFFRILKQNKVSIRSFLFYCSISIFLFIFLISFYSYITEAFFDKTDGSGYIKIMILKNYLTQSDLFSLLIGGHYGTQFDNDLGNWIGFSGFFGIIALFILYARLIYNNSTRAISISILTMGIGNTTFFGLLSAVIIVVLLSVRSDSYLFANEK